MRLLRGAAKFFGVGLVTILPFALVIWVLVLIFQLVDGLFGPWVDHWFGVDVPGVGFVLVVIGTTVVGFLMQWYVSHRFLTVMDTLFRRIPIVRTLYSTFQEIVQSVLGGKRRGFKRVVLVNWPDERARVVGFVTSEVLPPELDPTAERVAVFLPNSFQFSGITVIVDRNRVTDCNISVEEAFKFALAAGLAQTTVGQWATAHRVDRMPVVDDVVVDEAAVTRDNLPVTDEMSHTHSRSSGR